MATYVPSQLIDHINGSLGSSTFTQWKGMNVVRRRVEVMRNPQTDKQVRARQNFTELSKSWTRDLSPGDRAGWDNLATNKLNVAKEKFASSTVPSVIPKRKNTQSGMNRFIGMNSARTTGTINHQNLGEPEIGQTQTMIPSGATTAITFEPEQDHINPLTPCPSQPNRIKQSPPTGVQAPGQPKITNVGISTTGIPGDFLNTFPDPAVNGFNSPPVTDPIFVHVVVELPASAESSASDPTGILIPKDVVQNPDVPLKNVLRLWKKGPETTGSYILASVPYVAPTAGGYPTSRVASAGASVEFVFSEFPTPSDENPEPDPTQQTAIPPAPGIHDFQADALSDDGQIGPPSNEQKMIIGQPQSPCPGEEDEVSPFPEPAWEGSDVANIQSGFVGV